MMTDILEKVFWENRVLDYVACLTIFIIGVLAIKIFRSVILARLKKLTDKTATAFDDFLVTMFKKNLVPLLYFGVFYLAVRSLILHATLSKSIDVLGIVLLTIFAVRFLSSIIQFTIKEYWLKKTRDEKKEKSIEAILPAVRVIIWALAVVFLLDNLGLKISTVIAGLGIGGIAVALAAQAVLKDLFNYFAILFDRPFEVGDFIIMGDYLGTVEHIGIKTTRVRSLGGEQLVFSNSDLTDSRLRNYKRMEKRRVVFKLGVTYQTSHERLEEIPEIITNIIKNVDDAISDRAHFSSFGDFSLIFEVVYYVMSSDYNKYMDIQQRINLAINEEFEKRGIEFAYPTQTLFLTKENKD